MSPLQAKRIRAATSRREQGGAARLASERIEGVVDRITYRNDQTTYTVLQLELDSGARATLVGPMPAVQPGERLQAEGNWQVHPRYGPQFSVTSLTSVPPATPAAIERYLSSGLIRGVGPQTARKLVEAFGEQTLEVIANSPERLSEVPGIGPKKAAAIAEAATHQQDLRNAVLFLQGLGVSLGFAMRIYRQYGARTVQVVKENPYRLSYDVHGIGFKRADDIARALGIAEDAPQRREAAILHVLAEGANEGHVYLPESHVRGGLERLGLAAADLDGPLKALTDQGRAVIEVIDGERRIYLRSLFEAERQVAARLNALLDAGTSLPLEFAPAPEEGVELSEEQLRAVAWAMRYGILIITGGPGTGKTTVVRAVCRVFESAGLRIELAAPTGRAAQRLAETTGRPAKTIHRLLEVRGGGGSAPLFGYHEGRPLPADAVIVDEASMVDTTLMLHLLRALRPGTRLVLVGDEDQLPSVGPGQVLSDIIASGRVPCVRLTQVFRQAAKSLIVENAHRIRRGQWPVLGKAGQDFFFIEAEPAGLPDLVVDLMTRRLPAYLGQEAAAAIQVLTPVRRGPIGVEALNSRIQERLNPRCGPEVAVGGEVFRTGDKVMQVRNDYDNMVFNGDIGRIVRVDPDSRTVEVSFPDSDGERAVRYGEDALDQLTLAYAVSVHKSQGSEYPCIVMPITWVMPALMSRNLLYTALTRAKRLAVLVGEKRALGAYIRNDRAAERFTGLRERLLAAETDR